MLFRHCLPLRPGNVVLHANAPHSKRIDRRLLPILGAMYAISLIDRTNLGLAAVAGMNQDLKLDGDKYTIIIMLFFVMYIIFESKPSVSPRCPCTY